eukprot:TRINITY_DN34296_c0_g1_i1.p1 TRINITY_DN34296_c0_g1~~TRINITY_DN34296_c0_g1_i1.p1  ORF type:complete len:720 (+),score=77.81 TRINITY_DN34296_c0_g1_i1:94-2253(+)
MASSKLKPAVAGPCIACGRDTQRTCPKCRSVNLCSEACAAAFSNGHRAECRRLRSLSSPRVHAVVAAVRPCRKRCRNLRRWLHPRSGRRAEDGWRPEVYADPKCSRESVCDQCTVPGAHGAFVCSPRSLCRNAVQGAFCVRMRPRYAITLVGAVLVWPIVVILAWSRFSSPAEEAGDFWRAFDARFARGAVELRPSAANLPTTTAGSSTIGSFRREQHFHKQGQQQRQRQGRGQEQWQRKWQAPGQREPYRPPKPGVKQEQPPVSTLNPAAMNVFLGEHVARANPPHSGTFRTGHSRPPQRQWASPEAAHRPTMGAASPTTWSAHAASLLTAVESEKRYANLHRKMMTGTLPPRLLVWLSSGNGLGNRWETMAEFLLLAFLHDRAFLIASERGIFGTLFEPRSGSINFRLPGGWKRVLCLQGRARNIQLQTSMKLWDVSCDASGIWRDYFDVDERSLSNPAPSIVVMAGNFHTCLSGLFHWRGGPLLYRPRRPWQELAKKFGLTELANPVKFVWDSFFRFPSAVVKAASIFRHRLGQGYVAVHVRTRMLGDSETCMGGERLEEHLIPFRKCLSAALASGSLSRALFVAVDNAELDKPGMVEALFPGFSTYVVTNELGSLRACDAMDWNPADIRSYVDLYLLSEASALVGSGRSSFAWAAATIGDLPLLNGRLGARCQECGDWNWFEYEQPLGADGKSPVCAPLPANQDYKHPACDPKSE